jgi:hypothetical protein
MKNTLPFAGLDRLHLSARTRITRPAAPLPPLPRHDAGRAPAVRDELARTDVLRNDFLLDDLAPT